VELTSTNNKVSSDMLIDKQCILCQSTWKSIQIQKICCKASNWWWDIQMCLLSPF